MGFCWQRWWARNTDQNVKMWSEAILNTESWLVCSICGMIEGLQSWIKNNLPIPFSPGDFRCSWCSSHGGVAMPTKEYESIRVPLKQDNICPLRTSSNSFKFRNALKSSKNNYITIYNYIHVFCQCFNHLPPQFFSSHAVSRVPGPSPLWHCSRRCKEPKTTKPATQNLVGGWATPLKNMNVNWDD